MKNHVRHWMVDPKLETLANSLKPFCSGSSPVYLLAKSELVEENCKGGEAGCWPWEVLCKILPTRSEEKEQCAQES